MHYGIFNNIPGLGPPDASNMYTTLQLRQPKMSPGIAKYPLGGDKSHYSENDGLKERDEF